MIQEPRERRQGGMCDEQFDASIALQVFARRKRDAPYDRALWRGRKSNSSRATRQSRDLLFDASQADMKLPVDEVESKKNVRWIKN